MTAEQFAYWLQGFSELHGAAPSEEQWRSVKEHLALVFTKVTPPVRFPGELPPYMPNFTTPSPHYDRATC